MAPFGQAIIGWLGWQPAMFGFVAVALTMAALSTLVGATDRVDIAAAASPSAGTVRAALRQALTHRGFLAMTIAFFACGFQLVFITVHLPLYLSLCGMSPSVGANALALVGLCNTVGTYVFGQLGARYSKRRLLASIYLLRTTAIVVFLLVPISPASTLVFAAAMGFLWLGVTPLVTGIIGEMFGLAHFGTLFGVVFLSHQVGSFMGAWAGGLVFDLTGSYADVWIGAIVVGLAAALLQWPMGDRPTRGRLGVAPAG
jgi:predicted MFS family arabinose efflux permease